MNEDHLPTLAYRSLNPCFFITDQPNEEGRQIERKP